uniref:SCP domain-containing protein n=1 Tax=Strongyloides venezuelensis TaxID=75913 RepID=A0A0K0FEX5_STRVS
MYKFYNNNFIIFIIFSIYLFQCYGLENNVENDDSPLLNLVQNDLLSKNSINRDFLVRSLSDNDENKYLRKRQAEKKDLKDIKKTAIKTKSKTKLQKKTTRRLHPQPPKSSSDKPQKEKSSKLKTITRKTLPKATPTKKTTAKKTTTEKITPRTAQTEKTTILQTSTKKHSPTSSSESGTMSMTTTKPSCGSACHTTSRELFSEKNETSSQKPNTTENVSNSTSTTTTAITTISDKYAEQKSKLIQEINEARKIYHAQELIVDSELATTAQKLANESAEREQDVQNTDSNLGLLTYYSDIEDSDFGLSQWIAGSYNYNCDKLEDNPDWCDDFTQLIWASSKKIGCGISKSVENVIVVACLLYPKGNIKGEYQNNVFKKDN